MTEVLCTTHSGVSRQKVLLCSRVKSVAFPGPTRQSCFQLRGLNESSRYPEPTTVLHTSTPSSQSLQEAERGRSIGSY